MARKDWTGRGRNSIYSTLGASNHSNYDRVDDDYYATNPIAIDKLFAVHKFDKTIWECASGGGHLSKAIEKYGKSVYSTDLVDRGYCDDTLDFLTTDFEWHGDIITNPPYKYAKEFVEKGVELLKENRQLAMFLKTTFLEGKARYKLFKKYPPEFVYVFSERISVARNGEQDMFNKSSAASYSWFIWRKGYEGEPTVRWISPTVTPNKNKDK